MQRYFLRIAGRRFGGVRSGAPAAPPMRRPLPQRPPWEQPYYPKLALKKKG